MPSKPDKLKNRMRCGSTPAPTNIGPVARNWQDLPEVLRKREESCCPTATAGLKRDQDVIHTTRSIGIESITAGLTVALQKM
jgi:hypothetical protein